MLVHACTRPLFLYGLVWIGLGTTGPRTREVYWAAASADVSDYADQAPTCDGYNDASGANDLCEATGSTMNVEGAAIERCLDHDSNNAEERYTVRS